MHEYDPLDYHRRYQGKIEVHAKIPLETKDDLSSAYTPGVADVSSAIARDPALVYEYTMKRNAVAVVTDGSAVLGLGNLGPEAALPVMEGKAALFKRFGTVDAFPICLDVHDSDSIVKAVMAIAPVFGGINLEDIASPKCFEIEERLRDSLAIPVMHDDQHGTATVVLAALVNAVRLTDRRREDVQIVINGAGAAGTAVALLLNEYGFPSITVLDRKGMLVPSREDLTPAKRALVEKLNIEQSRKTGDLRQALAGADVFIGVSSGNLLTEDMIRTMREKPIIFALANPTPEIQPERASSAGAAIVATGRSDFPNQVNNVLVFPGIFRGALDRRVRRLTRTMFLRAAENLAQSIANPTPDHILPSVFDPAVMPAVASAIHEENNEHDPRN
ncbi:MAG: NADP-dependent malic enzyme [Parcubacteria group bacterium]|nr:NADP-dependent malic enzyme [Parcubacteria group bacterium]